MTDKYTMEELVNKLNVASEAYYNGREIMSDHEFDELMESLMYMEAKEGDYLPNSPTHSVGAPAVDTLEKFKHTYPALSLDKTKDVDLLVQKFAEGIVESGGDNNKVVLMYKEDGSTAQAYYKRGRLERLVTRGNGEIGSVVTHNARNIQGLPITITYKGDLVVRGEVLMSYAEFDRINNSISEENRFRNPRNLASATLTMLDSHESAERELHFKAFNLVHISDEVGTFYPEFKLADSFGDRLDLLDDLGFDTVDRKVCELNELKQSVDFFTDNAPLYPYPVDGLVVAMDNYQYSRKLEGTEHHPHIMQGYAFKWADEEIETVLREIEWSPSRTGLLNPVAIFDPVEIDGTTVSRASVHNVSIVKEMNLRVGDRVTVFKSNMIIPQISHNLDRDSHPCYTDDELEYEIGFCPTCGAHAEIRTSPDGIKTASCPNAECEEKIIGKIEHFCSRECMDIEGLSEETIRKLHQAGFIKEYSDIFNLYFKPEIQYLPGFGKQSWDKLCDAARKAKESATFVKFITALSIPNIGKGQAKALYKYINDNYEGLCKVTGLPEEEFNLVRVLAYLPNRFDFSSIDGIGDIIAKSLKEWLVSNFDLPTTDTSPFIKIDTPEIRVYHMLTFTDEPPVVAKESSITGKNICITGKLISFKNRQALVDVIEQNGGKWVDSVSSKTDYLINNDTTSTSGKNKKAKDLNIPIISEEEFIAMLG